MSLLILGSLAIRSRPGPVVAAVAAHSPFALARLILGSLAIRSRPGPVVAAGGGRYAFAIRSRPGPAVTLPTLAAAGRV